MAIVLCPINSCTVFKSNPSHHQPTSEGVPEGVPTDSLDAGLLRGRREPLPRVLHQPVARLGCGTLVAEELFRTACEIHKELVPGSPIRPEHADTVQLVCDVTSGKLDAAIATLPIEHPELCVEEVRRDRLVVCLRADHPLSAKAALRPADLQGTSGFFITRSTTRKLTPAFWNYWPRRASKSTSFPAPLTRRKCSVLFETDTE